MDLMGGMFSQIGNWVHDWATSAWKQDKAEGMMEDAQNFSRDAQTSAQNFSERMFDNRYRKTTQDLMGAGLNPMLSYMHGPGGAPSGSPVSGPGAGAPPFNNTGSSLAASLQSAAQVKLIDAEEDRVRAEADEIRARTPTHAVSMQQMQQNIAESQQRVDQSIQQVQNLRAGEALSRQQITNLQETIPHLQALVRQLDIQGKLTTAQTHQAYTQSGLTAAQDEETRQRIRANLPQIQRAVQELEERFRQLQLPQRGMDAAAHSSFLGALGAVGRALNPFNNLFK